MPDSEILSVSGLAQTIIMCVLVVVFPLHKKVLAVESFSQTLSGSNRERVYISNWMELRVETLHVI
jgi:hypothetical protein